MKKALIILGILASINIYSQKVGYFYDDAGNRTQRKLCPTCRLAPPDEETETASKLNATILPNPTEGSMIIEVTEKVIINGEEESNFQVIVYDIYGREVINERHNSTTFSIDITGKPPGVYFVKLTAANKVKRWEIVKK